MVTGSQDRPAAVAIAPPCGRRPLAAAHFFHQFQHDPVHQRVTFPGSPLDARQAVLGQEPDTIMANICSLNLSRVKHPRPLLAGDGDTAVSFAGLGLRWQLASFEVSGLAFCGNGREPKGDSTTCALHLIPVTVICEVQCWDSAL